MTRNPDRPLSPHLTIWRWGPGMLVSILHRITGGALAVAGLVVLTWALWAAMSGDAQFATFLDWMNHPVGIVVLVGLTWAFWQHLFSGLRHLLLDTGAGFELKINRAGSVATIVLAIFFTALTWAYGVGAIG